MKKRKKPLKQKLSEFTYGKSALDKRFVDLKKGFREIEGMLEDKKKH